MTRQGLDRLLQSHNNNGMSVWIPDGILTPKELAQLRTDGIDITNFSRTIQLGDVDAIADAINTIKEHHPQETLWIEG